MRKFLLTRNLIPLLFLLFTFSNVTQAQKDKEFWFIAPAISDDHSAENSCGCNGPNSKCGAAPVSINITNANDSVAASVIIEQPSNAYDATLNPTGFKPIYITVPPNSFHREELWSNNLCDLNVQEVRKNVENRLDPLDPTKPLDKGLHITSTEYITVYYEVEEQNNSDVYSLKGANALGDLFYCNFQTNKPNATINSQRAFSSINVVAVDPGVTRVWVYPTNEVIGWGQPDSFYVDLQQGQSIALIPGVDNGGGSYTYNLASGKRLNGTKISTKSGKRIAVTLSDDSVKGDTGCYDQLGDQTVPVQAVSEGGARNDLIGSEYIIMKGDLGGGNNDRIYILATKDNTEVIVTDVTNGTSVTYSGLMEMQQQKHTIASNGNITYVESTDANKPVYVLHVTGAGNGCELGEAIIPTVSACTGSFDVGFSRGSESGKDFLLNIMVREENDNDSARYAFIYSKNGNPANPIPAIGDDFTKIPGTKWWAAQLNFDDSVRQYEPQLISNTKNIFHLGTLNGGGTNGGNYGYFSNYSVIEARSYVSGVGQPGVKLCWGESTQLVADGGLSYEWIPDTYLSDAFVQKPYCTPLTNIKYDVVVKGASCAMSDTAQIEVLVSDSLSADFILDRSFGCAPFTINASNKSFNAKDNFWYVNGSFYYYGSTPPPISFTNQTDTAQDVQIKLVTRGIGGCVKAYSRYVRVYPEIDTYFSTDTIAGCHPLQIAFSDSSVGNTDTAGYYWDFNDLEQSTQINPTHTFQNIGSNDITYRVKLLTVSPFLCEDSAFVDITVHPVIQAKLAIDTAKSCSPLLTELDPTNAIGVDTFYYSVTHQYGNQNFQRTNNTPLQITHIDTSQAYPDTLHVNMFAMNRMGCTDTLDTRNIIVYPEVIASIGLDTNVICDSLSIQFTNNSTGFNLDYEWVFGDGSNSTDSHGGSYTHYYLNRGTDVDKTFAVTLQATSEYFCFDQDYDTITVHPFVRSAFNLDFDGSCTPLDVTLQNSSIGINTYDIYWGDNTSLLNQAALYKENHRFINPDPINDTTYFIKLITEHTVGGCTDSTIKSVKLFPQVAANFNLTDSVGCHPLDVQFENVSKGTALTYNWTFGDGAGSDTAVANFARTYKNFTSADKVYDVSLHVTNDYGCDSSISKQVEVFAFIDALFNIEVVDSCSPFPVRVQNFSPAGATNFQWDFDDGSLLDINKAPEHVYYNKTTTSQSRNVRLVVNNNHFECADTAYQTVTVRPEMLASFSPDLFSGCQPLSVGIVNNSNLTSNTDFSWDFGDTTFYYGVTPPSHLYENRLSTAITRDIILRAVSEHYCFDDTTLSVEIFPLIEARFSIDIPEICSGELFTIDPSASRGLIKDYLWNTDETPGAEESRINKAPFTYTFTNTTNLSDDIVVELVTTNAYNCTDTATENILVRPLVDAQFTITPDEECYPFTATITNNTPSGADQAQIFEWSLGDGSTSNSTSTSFTHFYKNLSTLDDSVYVINLYTKSIYNCADSLRDTLIVHPKPNSDFIVDNAISCPPYDPGIHNTSSGTNLSYDWVFPAGNPSVSSVGEPNVEFINDSTSILTNKVRLITTTAFGCADTSIKNIRVYPSVRTSIAATPTASCHPLYTAFTGSEATNAFSFEWTVDGETFSIEEQPKSIYFGNETTEDKEVEVVLYGESANGCKDWDTVYLSIFPNPNVDFIPQPMAQDYDISDDATTFDFKNITNSRDNWIYTWDFADDSSSAENAEIVSHTYGNEFWGDVSNDNKLFISLHAYNPVHPQCRDSVEHFIVINPPAPIINIGNEIELCGEDTLYLSSSYRYIYDDSFNWDFGDGRTSTDPDPEYVIYQKPGRYIIRLEVNGDGGSAWDFKEITIHEKPIVDFTFYPEIATAAGINEIPDTIYFQNLTKHGQIYEWKFFPIFDGELQTTIVDSTEHPKRVFSLYERSTDSTYYAIQLKSVNVVTPSLQCVDSVLQEITFKIVPGGLLKLPNAMDLSNPDRKINTFLPYIEHWLTFEMEIYDRWGTLLYASTDPVEGWDGTIESSGEMVKPGVYVYKVKASFTNGRSVVKTGDITVLKTSK